MIRNFPDMNNKEALFSNADKLRQKFFGRKISLCAIINARNGLCEMDCAFCAQSKNNPQLGATWPLMEPHVLKNKVIQLLKKPINRIGIVTSGKKLAEQEFDKFCNFLELCEPEIRSRLCASLGSLSREKLGILMKLGLTHYHHNLETSEKFYPNVSRCQKWRDRLRTVINARELGFFVCSGGIFGIGETWEDRKELAITLADAGISNIPLNFFTPVSGTPLEKRKVLDPDSALKIIALFRNILPSATLRICGGRPATMKNESEKIFLAGANALMTGDYLTTKGFTIEDDLLLIKSNGYELSENAE